MIETYAIPARLAWARGERRARRPRCASGSRVIDGSSAAVSRARPFATLPESARSSSKRLVAVRSPASRRASVLPFARIRRDLRDQHRERDHRQRDDQHEEEDQTDAKAHPLPGIRSAVRAPCCTSAPPWEARPGGARLARPGAIAQLGERLVRNQEVVGSSPTSSTTSGPAWRCGIGDPLLSRSRHPGLVSRRPGLYGAPQSAAVVYRGDHYRGHRVHP